MESKNTTIENKDINVKYNKNHTKIDELYIHYCIYGNFSYDEDLSINNADIKY